MKQVPHGLSFPRVTVDPAVPYLSKGAWAGRIFALGMITGLGTTVIMILNYS